MFDRIHRRFYDRAAKGLPVLGTPTDRAESARSASETPHDGAKLLERKYVLWSGLTGFVCGLPGYGSMPVTIPSNVAGALLLQFHLCASIAAIAGRNPNDEEVRRWALETVRFVDETPEDPDSQADKAAGENAPSEEDRSLIQRVTSKMAERAIRFAGEQSTGWVGRASRTGRATRSLPLLGGAIGGLADGYSTRRIARRARRSMLGHLTDE